MVHDAPCSKPYGQHASAGGHATAGDPAQKQHPRRQLADCSRPALQASGYFAALVCNTMVSPTDLQRCLEHSPHSAFSHWGLAILGMALARVRSHLASLAAGASCPALHAVPGQAQECRV